jgi:hypothetical protein
VTAVVGLTHDRRTYIGADSAGIDDGWALVVRADAKVFRNGPYLFGFTSSFRMGQLLRWSLSPPAPTGDLERFMATTFVDAIRACLRDGGWARKDNEQESGGTFLVGTGGRLFRIEGDYQVGEPVDGYDAVGCGGAIALGALHATAGLGLPPKTRVGMALRAAERFSGGVRGPFLCLSVR